MGDRPPPLREFLTELLSLFLYYLCCRFGNQMLATVILIILFIIIVGASIYHLGEYFRQLAYHLYYGIPPDDVLMRQRDDDKENNATAVSKFSWNAT